MTAQQPGAVAEGVAAQSGSQMAQVDRVAALLRQRQQQDHW